MINKGTTKVSKIFKGTTKVKYVYKGTTKVWSGASLVSYYDGETLIGTEEVDEGLDVLHPSLDTSKEGYTLFGWSITDGGERVSVLGATGEPMSIYAIYVPNTLQAFVATMPDKVYNVTLKNERYVTGNTMARAARAAYLAGGGEANAASSFAINLVEYQTATVSGKGFTYGYGTKWDEHAYLDNVDYVDQSFNKTYTASGSHSLHAHGQVASGQNDLDVGICILNITLTNPVAWV